jgi:hypothetical protein
MNEVLFGVFLSPEAADEGGGCSGSQDERNDPAPPPLSM